jgi:hypothetical protein
MQRSSLKVEKKKADEEEPNGSFPSLRTVAKKWYRYFFLLDVYVLLSSDYCKQGHCVSIVYPFVMCFVVFTNV